ncbi:hypothetical protein [Candidatus Nitrospira inopinata]|nr:hypothetical protein [Candidatus Nitrospira inopinata]
MVSFTSTIHSRRGVPLALVLLLCFASGCALTAKQKAAVSQFSDSAATLGDVTSSELQAMRDGTINMTIERLLLGGKSKDPNLGDQTSLDRGFELNRVETITGATHALAGYGKTLAALVADSQSADLSAASHEFTASLSRIPEARQQLSDDQLEAIATAVQGVGRFWVEWKRKEAVITIVKASQQAVDRLCDLLIRDFDPKRGWVALQLQVIEDPLMAEATNALYDGETYHDRKIALRAFRLAYENRMRRTEILSRVVEAAQAMKQANTAVVRAVDHFEWSVEDIRSFAERARSLKHLATIIPTH